MARIHQLGTHCTTAKTVEDRTTVTYHETDVVIFDDLTVKLDNGGYETPTTKLRMNQAANQFDLRYHVYQHKGVWFVDTPTCKAVPFDPHGRIEFKRN